ncbi:MAG: YncE family protein, partial [Acidobacteria bacterium]|nr:YncE family protein [Acidobacteriota bacterium]
MIPLLLAVSWAATESYHLVHTYKFGGAPGGREYFDYINVDPATRRAYLSHGTEVLVVNADTGQLEGKISGLKLSHGVALVPDQGRGFITDGEQGKIVIFDLKTLKVIGDVPAAPDADSILYDPSSKHIFSFNGDSRNSTVVDPATGKVIGTIDLGGSPEFAVADGKGTIYDNLEDKSEVLAIDSKTLAIKSHWPVAPAGAPASMAIDRDHRRLFVSGRNPAMLVVMNADDGRVIQSFPISAGADA